MNPLTILALLASLFEQVQMLAEKLVVAERRIAELESVPTD